MINNQIITMKVLIFISIVSIFGSCGSAQKLLERETDDGSKIVVKKDFFSGIDYLHIEKKNKGKVVYYIFYDCECGIGNKIGLRKGVGQDQERTLWVGVTDTTSSPNVFGEPIVASRLITPIEFIPITQEEKSLLEGGLSKVDKDCCKPSGKPLNKFIGYVRVRTN
jgi:hypothetical protein